HRSRTTATCSPSCGPWPSMPLNCSRMRFRRGWSAFARSASSDAAPGSFSTLRATTAGGSAAWTSAATVPSNAATTNGESTRSLDCGGNACALCRRRAGGVRRMAERYIVVGGGLAGLMTVIKLPEAGKHVDVFSIVPVKRSHSVCAQGGINSAVNTKGEGDHPDIHVKDTLKGGDFLAEQPPVKGMCYAAPQIIYLLDRMGVPFNRTNEGLLDFRRFGGTLHNRTAFAGASTGQQLLYALDEQVRRYEHDGLVRKYEYWEYLSFIRDEQGACRGIVALDLRTMEIEAFAADAVCLATGGPGIVYGRSTNSTINTGSANGRTYMDGAAYTNAEFIQVHPTAIPGEDKHRLMSESARGEGGRVWVPKKKGDTRDSRTIPEDER